MFTETMRWGLWAMHSDACFRILENPEKKVCLRTSWKLCWRQHTSNVRASLWRVRMFGLQNALKCEHDNFTNNDLYWCIKHYANDLVQVASVSVN